MKTSLEATQQSKQTYFATLAMRKFTILFFFIAAISRIEYLIMKSMLLNFSFLNHTITVVFSLKLQRICIVYIEERIDLHYLPSCDLKHFGAQTDHLSLMTKFSQGVTTRIKYKHYQFFVKEGSASGVRHIARLNKSSRNIRDDDTMKASKRQILVWEGSNI